MGQTNDSVFGDDKGFSREATAAPEEASVASAVGQMGAVKAKDLGDDKAISEGLEECLTGIVEALDAIIAVRTSQASTAAGRVAKTGIAAALIAITLTAYTGILASRTRSSDAVLIQAELAALYSVVTAAGVNAESAMAQALESKSMAEAALRAMAFERHMDALAKKPMVDMTEQELEFLLRTPRQPEALDEIARRMAGSDDTSDTSVEDEPAVKKSRRWFGGE